MPGGQHSALDLQKRSARPINANEKDFIVVGLDEGVAAATQAPQTKRPGGYQSTQKTFYLSQNGGF